MISEQLERREGERTETNLSSKMRFAERPVESDEIPSFDEGDSERRRCKVLDVPLLLLHNILSLDDGGDVFSDGRVGS